MDKTSDPMAPKSEALNPVDMPRSGICRLAMSVPMAPVVSLPVMSSSPRILPTEARVSIRPMKVPMRPSRIRMPVMYWASDLRSSRRACTDSIRVCMVPVDTRTTLPVESSSEMSW